MAVLDFTFANGGLTVTGGGRIENFYSTDFRAKSREDKVVIFPINQDDNNKHVQRDWEYPYTDVSCQGVAYTSAEDFVIIFNALAGASIGFNTKYPEIWFSQTIELDTSVDEQVVPLWCVAGHNAGWLTISAPSTNTGNIYFGESDVSNDSDYLEPTEARTIELSDLSLIWVQSTTPNDVVRVHGAAKI
jgi:hypothetical protein